MNSPTRRQTLALLGTTGVTGALSGCSAVMGTITSPDLPLEVSLTDIDDVAPEHALSISASMAESGVTTDHPAKVAVTLTNEGSPRRVDGETYPTFDFVGDGQAKMALYHSTLHEKLMNGRFSAPCWQAPKPRVFTDRGGLGPVMESGEHEKTEFELWGVGGPNDTQCLQTGDVRFENQYTYAPRDGDDPTTLQWGCTLTIATM